MKPSTAKKLYELLQFARDNGLSELAWQENGVKISFKQNSSPSKKKRSQKESPKSSVESIPFENILSPIVGTFRRSGSKNSPPLVLKGSTIKPGEKLGVVECMKIPTEVICRTAGEIEQVLVEDGQSVEYGQPLFSIKPFNGKGPAPKK